MITANTGLNIPHNFKRFLSNNDTTLVVKPDKATSAKLSSKTITSLFILMIEDDPIVQRVHSMMLEKLGHRVEIAGNGLDALTLFSQNNYDLILMDIGLPVMNGIEITAEIRRREQCKKNVPIIAVTAYVQEETKNDCLAAGANAVATKPITIETLHELLQRFSGVEQ